MLGTILVVDDESDLLRLLRLILERNGYSAIVAAGGDEALRYLETECPDLVLCDILMPECDGYHLLQEIRSHPRTQDLPVLMLSAKGRSADVQRALNAGANGYLVKPFQLRELLDLIQAHIPKRGDAR